MHILSGSHAFLLYISVTLVMISFFYSFSISKSLRKRSELFKPLPYENLSLDKSFPQTQKSNSSQQDVYNTKMRKFIKLYIHDYVSKHRKVRHLCNRNMSVAQNVKLLIYKGNPQYGMGDRIRGALYAFIVASITERILLIEMEKPVPLDVVWKQPNGSNFTLDHALFSLPTDTEKVTDSTSDINFTSLAQYNTTARVLLQHTMRGFNMRALLNISNFVKPARRKRRAMGLEGFVPSDTDVAPFVMKALFRPSKALRSKISDLYPFRNNKYFGIHARLGHGLGEYNERFNPHKYGLTLADLAVCIGRVGASHARQHGLRNIFICTDTRRMNSKIREGVKQVLPYARTSFAKGRAVHVADLVMKPKSQTKMFEFFITAFADLGLLASSENIVSFESGFVDIAAWLGVFPERVVVNKENCKVQKYNYTKIL